jgi:2-succinyl-5-enolpyruvyl-6-hydroxy-3-cyclohexene-1-carboxylate synthase
LPTSKALRNWLAARGARQLVLDPEGAWNEPTTVADEIVRTDPGALAAMLADLLPGNGDGQWAEAWGRAAAAAETAIDDFLGGLGDELFEPRVHRELGALLPARSTIYVASSMPVRDLEGFFPATDKQLRFLANRGANGIDGLVSSGLGAAAGAPGRTFVLIGDLGLYHDMNGLLAYRRLDVEATFVVFDNGGGGIFDFLPIAEYRDGYEELFGTPTGLDLSKVAALYGLPFTVASSHAELAGALDRPGLVRIPLSRPRNVDLHRALFERVAAAVQPTVGG